MKVGRDRRQGGGGEVGYFTLSGMRDARAERCVVLVIGRTRDVAMAVDEPGDIMVIAGRMRSGQHHTGRVGGRGQQDEHEEDARIATESTQDHASSFPGNSGRATRWR